MIEIEFSALTRLGLARRILVIEQLECEVLALVAERKTKQIKFSWQFYLRPLEQNSIHTMLRWILTI